MSTRKRVRMEVRGCMAATQPMKSMIRENTTSSTRMWMVCAGNEQSEIKSAGRHVLSLTDRTLSMIAAAEVNGPKGAVPCDQLAIIEC
jgi:hypothetical protein